METFYTVYRTTNTVTRRFYIGVHKTTDPNDGYLGSGLALKDAIKKYGRSSFTKEVLFSFDNPADAYAKEKELVTKALIESGQVYNIATGGVQSIDWGNRRKATALRGKDHPQFGKKRTNEQKLATSETLKKTWETNNEKLVAGIAKGAEKRRGVPSPLLGSTQSAESNTKRSISHRNLAKKECPHCHGLVSPQNLALHHGDRCPVLTGRPSRSKFVRNNPLVTPV
jgi:hypothetical protein